MEKIEVKSVNLNVTTLTMKVGETVTVKATVLPVDATDKAVTWTSADPTVATVVDGVITALKLGTASITAKAGDKTASCRVTVEPTPVASVTLDQTSARLSKGETIKLNAVVIPDDATYKTVTWSSSGPQVATVNDGSVTALLVGTTTISAVADGVTATCQIEVIGSGDYAEIALGNNGPRADKATIIVVVNQKCRAGTSVMHYSLYGSTDYNPYYSVNYCALGRYSQEMDEIMQHEICGHGFASLGDEYFYASSSIEVNFPLFERLQSKGMYRNIDKYIDENLQSQGVDYPLTTKENVYWKDLFNTVNNYESSEALGVFKGAYTYSFGYCRPTEDGSVSVMGNGYMFNAPSRRAIYYKYLRASGKLQSNVFGTEEELAAFLKWDSGIQKKIKSSSAYVRGNLSGASTTSFAPPALKSGHLVNGRFVTDPVPSRSIGTRVSGR
ncbi:MAG: Ig domain-containing protein [Candidatus Cryptobacteroides sp.]